MNEHHHRAEDTGRTSVVLVDDHSMVREAISARIQEEDDLEIVGTAAEGEEAVPLCQRLQPDVVVLDIDLPGPSAFDTGKKILETTTARVLYLSGHSKDRYVDAAIAVGASGYVLKDEGLSVLVTAIRQSAHEPFFSEGIRERLAETSIEDPVDSEKRAPGSRGSLLTERELEVLRLLARGYSKKEISAMIGKSYSTVDKRVSRIMEKLQFHDRVDLARFAIREGIVEP